MTKRIISLILSLTILLISCLSLFSCTPTTDAFVIMTETLDGLFNPFFATSGNDSTIVGMTQLGMLTTDLDAEGNVIPAYGDNHAVVVKDMDKIYNSATKTTDYIFVIKNGIKFSDGKPLTMNDVLFNMYVYLDPVYTGSSTMYSTDIVGLTEYRTQSNLSGEGAEDLVIKQSKDRAQNRINELINLYTNTSKVLNGGSDNLSVPYADMVAAINAYSVTPGYQDAISNNPSEVTNAQLLADYELALRLFKEELGRDFDGAIDSYKNNEPYKNYTGLEWNEVQSFMYTEGYISLEYKNHGTADEDRSVIVGHTIKYNESVVVDRESAINLVYNDKIESELHIILQYWATANELATQYAAKAMEVILRENMTGDSLLIPNISGIKSLGHVTDETSITIGNNVYPIARQHNTDGTPVNADEYDVLKITINGTDPKAVWNFAFSVAPQHYYAPNQTVDIANNKFGVEFGSFDFMQNEIQSTRNVKVPMGAGAYQATDVNNSDNPTGTAFYSANVVYFKRNDYFLLGQPKIEKIRYQVTSASNALNALENGAVHYVSPQYTNENYTKLTQLADKGFKMLSTDQLGYGYIGINAAKIPELELRQAIMVAMDTSQALAYYNTGTAETIYWPMSMVSWAYPKDENGQPDRMNGKEYIQINFDEAFAKQKIQQYMSDAGVSAGNSKLSIKFTIAGSNVTDHPTYNTFVKAAKILNECGWDIQVVPDVNALTKLSTGSLTVWAAAWGSTIDPDMYQVYHKNSTATSVLAWGYNAILADQGTYYRENAILNTLSELIDDARETDDQDIRSDKYKQAMSKVLDLAVELPVYQRDVLYAYNSNIINPDTLPSTINPYTSPLDKLWEIEFNEGVLASEGDNNTGLIIGIVVGAVVLAGGAGVGVFMVISKKKKALAGGDDADELDTDELDTDDNVSKSVDENVDSDELDTDE